MDTPGTTTPPSLLATTLAGIDLQHGPGTLMTLGGGPVAPVEALSSGVEALDAALGCGGFPRGRMIEIFGASGCGKTTLALQAIACCQAAGGTATFLDLERAFDPAHAKALGVSLPELLLSQPTDGEQALDVTLHLCRSGAIDLLALDSVAALVPRAELAGDLTDPRLDLQARLMSRSLRRLASALGPRGPAVLFLNQLRTRTGESFGPREVTTGGNALKFYASQRLELQLAGRLLDGGRHVGSQVRARVVKNKLAPPFRVAELALRFGGRFSGLPEG